MSIKKEQKLTGQGHEGAFWRERHVLCLNQGGDNRIMYIYKNP